MLKLLFVVTVIVMLTLMVATVMLFVQPPP
jgi:hypothetical protein